MILVKGDEVLKISSHQDLQSLVLELVFDFSVVLVVASEVVEPVPLVESDLLPVEGLLLTPDPGLLPLAAPETLALEAVKLGFFLRVGAVVEACFLSETRTELGLLPVPAAELEGLLPVTTAELGSLLPAPAAEPGLLPPPPTEELPVEAEEFAIPEEPEGTTPEAAKTFEEGSAALETPFEEDGVPPVAAEEAPELPPAPFLDEAEELPPTPLIEELVWDVEDLLLPPAPETPLVCETALLLATELAPLWAPALRVDTPPPVLLVPTIDEETFEPWFELAFSLPVPGLLPLSLTFDPWLAAFLNELVGVFFLFDSLPPLISPQRKPL